MARHALTRRNQLHADTIQLVSEVNTWVFRWVMLGGFVTLTTVSGTQMLEDGITVGVIVLLTGAVTTGVVMAYWLEGRGFDDCRNDEMPDQNEARTVEFLSATMAHERAVVLPDVPPADGVETPDDGESAPGAVVHAGRWPRAVCWVPGSQEASQGRHRAA